MDLSDPAPTVEPSAATEALVATYRELLALQRHDPARVDPDQLERSTNQMGALYAREKAADISLEVVALIRQAANMGVGAAKKIPLPLDRWSRELPPPIRYLKSPDEMKGAIQALERSKAPWLIGYMLSAAVDPSLEKSVRGAAKKAAEKKVLDARTLFSAAAQVIGVYDPKATLTLALELFKKRQPMNLIGIEGATEDLVTAACAAAKRSNPDQGDQLFELQASVSRLLAEVALADPGCVVSLPFLRATLATVALSPKPTKDASKSLSTVVHRIWSIGRRCGVTAADSKLEVSPATLEWFTAQIDISSQIRKAFPDDDVKAAFAKKALMNASLATGVDGRVAVAELLRDLMNLTSGNPDAVPPEFRSLCESTASRNGVWFVGKPGEVLRYDPLAHFLTSPLPSGVLQVTVVEPAIHIRHEDGSVQIYVRTLVEPYKEA
jgi:hypothetical protein